MKTSFDWSVLKLGKCPNLLCNDGVMKRISTGRVCTLCAYFISEFKYRELMKGRNSKYYKQAKKQYRKIDDYRKTTKERLRLASELQKKEIEYNRQKILREQTQRTK